MSIDVKRTGPSQLWLGAFLVLVLACLYNFIGLEQTPPGLDRDAAANGWLALNWLRDGIVPFWMPHAGAPEPLIVWLQSGTSALFGPSVFALRAASALFLSLAAPAIYWLAYEVAKPFPPTQRFWAALLAGLIFACNPVVTQLARTGLRATTLPLISTLFFICLLRAWRTNRRRNYLFAGLLLGTAAYTYLAARFLPIVVVIFVVVAWWAEQRGEGEQEARNWRVRSSGLVLMVITALVIVLPQLFFFWDYPMAFLARAQSVSLFANPALEEMGPVMVSAQKLLALLRMFGIAWSGQYNQAQWPLLSPVAFGGLILSLPLIVRWRRQPGLILVVVAAGVLLLPDLIGGDRLLPHELRVIGAYGPLMVLSGVGLAYGVGWILERVHRTQVWPMAGTFVALLVAGWGLVGWFGFAAPALAKSDYDWFATPDVALAQAINSHEQPLIVPLNEYSRSIVAYLSAKRVKHLQSGIDAHGQVIRPEGEEVLLLWPANPERTRVESTSYRFDPASLVLVDGAEAYLMPPATADVVTLQQGCDPQPYETSTGQVAGVLCEVNFSALGFPTEIGEPEWAVGDLYDGALRLQGVNAVTTTLSPSMTLGITSLWRAEQPTSKRWRYFVHILDDQQQVVAGDDLMPGYSVYETPLWQEDETIPIFQSVQLPQELAPGRYWIEVGLYDPLTQKRAVASDSGADRSLVGPLKVPLLPGDEIEDTLAANVRFGDELLLEGYRVLQDSGENGGELGVILQLAALRQPLKDYTAFLHLEDASGEIVAQSDAQPRAGQYPTSIWDGGEQVVSEWRIALPQELAPGKYHLWMGLYDAASGERLPIEAIGAGDEVTSNDDRYLLGELEFPAP